VAHQPRASARAVAQRLVRQQAHQRLVQLALAALPRVQLHHPSAQLRRPLEHHSPLCLAALPGPRPLARRHPPPQLSGQQLLHRHSHSPAHQRWEPPRRRRLVKMLRHLDLAAILACPLAAAVCTADSRLAYSSLPPRIVSQMILHDRMIPERGPPAAQVCLVPQRQVLEALCHLMALLRRHLVARAPLSLAPQHPPQSARARHHPLAVSLAPLLSQPALSVSQALPLLRRLA
jgi:hypothetical protein